MCDWTAQRALLKNVANAKPNGTLWGAVASAAHRDMVDHFGHLLNAKQGSAAAPEAERKIYETAVRRIFALWEAREAEY